MSEPLTTGGNVVIVSTTGSPGPPGPVGNTNVTVAVTAPVGAPDNQVWVQIPQTPQAPPSVAGIANQINDTDNFLGNDPTNQRYIATITGLTPNAVGTAWDAIAAGSQITDLLQLDNSAWTGGTFQNSGTGVVSMKVPSIYSAWYLDYGSTRIKVTPIVAFPGAIKMGAATTSNRPSAVVAKVGAMFYDTTLHKPIWSDGTVWRDSAGTAV